MEYLKQPNLEFLIAFVSPPNLYSGKKLDVGESQRACPGTSASELCSCRAQVAGAVPSIGCLGLKSHTCFDRFLFQRLDRSPSMAEVFAASGRVAGTRCALLLPHEADLLLGHTPALGQRDCSASCLYCLRTRVILLRDACGNSLSTFKIFSCFFLFHTPAPLTFIDSF